MSDLKRQAEKMGLQVGSNIKIEHTKRKQGTATKMKLTGEIIALYPHIFVAELQIKQEKIKESFQYGQVVLTKEVTLS